MADWRDACVVRHFTGAFLETGMHHSFAPLVGWRTTVISHWSKHQDSPPSRLWSSARSQGHVPVVRPGIIHGSEGSSAPERGKVMEPHHRETLNESGEPTVNRNRFLTFTSIPDVLLVFSSSEGGRTATSFPRLNSWRCNRRARSSHPEVVKNGDFECKNIKENLSCDLTDVLLIASWSKLSCF